MIRNYIPLLVASLILLSGCLEDHTPDRVGNTGYSIPFEFTIPDAVETTRATPTLTDESAIDNMYVFVFESVSNTLDHWVKATITTSSGGTTTGTITLNEVENTAVAHKLVFLANIEEEILTAAGSTITKGMLYAAFESALTTDISSIITTEPASSFRFPMWGESASLSLSAKPDLTGTNAIKMQRSLSKIDIAVNLQSNGTASGLSDFNLREIIVCNVNSNAFVIPASGNRGSDGYVTHPTVSGTSKVNVQRSISPGQHGSLSSIYVPETYNNTSTAAADRPYVIIKGVYLGFNPGNAIETYYRIDFVTGQERELVDIMRNYSYTFNITEVRREGYLTLDEAINNLPVGLSYEFIPSQNFPDEYFLYKYYSYNDVGYIALVNNDRSFAFSSGSYTNFEFKAEYMGNTAPQIEGYFCDENGNQTNTAQFNGVISDYLSVKRATISALRDNETANNIMGYYKIFLADNPDLHMILKFEQEPFTMNVSYISMACTTFPNGAAIVPNHETYTIRYFGLLPTSKFRITKGSVEDAAYEVIEVDDPGNTSGYSYSDPFTMTPNTSGNYMKLVTEWYNPYTSEWLDFATFEVVGTNYRHSTNSRIYLAVNDMEYTPGGYTPGTGVYTGWSWTEALGVSPDYETTRLSLFGDWNSGNYVLSAVTPTGCGAYWEGSINDPVTGQGRWRAPVTGTLSAARTNYFNTGGYLGIPVGAVDLTATYLTCSDAATTFTTNILTATTTNAQKYTAPNYRLRCVRFVE